MSIKKLLFTVLISHFIFSISVNAQTTVSFSYTGGVQNWVVPPCVTSINVTAAGADGGGSGGGNGAVVTGTLTVTPGQTLQITVGGTGNCPGGGYGGGGAGANASTGPDGGCGGGGATTINVSPFTMASRVLVAGGGGGMGGGTTNVAGGAAGCATGTAGNSPFGVGGGGGTQTAGGTAGSPWISSGNWGTAGSLGVGGNGGTDPCYNVAPGGGGGGGYYGGGGGGSDCFSSAPYGGGSGGGGSSLVPAGGGCNPGTNNGPGYVTITYTITPPPANAGPDVVRCFGGAAVTIGADPVCPIEGTPFSWSNSAGSGTIDLSGGGQNHGQATVSPTSTTTYTLTVGSAGCISTDQVTVVVDMPPTASNPAPISVQCASDVPAPNVAVVTTEADDITNPPTVTWISDTPSAGTCPQTISRVYRVTDACGNFVNVTQTITVSATVSVTMPPNGSSTVACPSATSTAPTPPTVLDACGRTLTVSAPVISAIPTCSGTRTYTYTYTNCLGGTYPWVYTYTVSAPTVTMPANGSSTVACPSATSTAPTPPTVLDNCGRTLTVSAPVVSAIPTCSGTRTYTYTYTSCSGTTYPWVYTYTVSAPTVTMPANGGSTVACPSATSTAPTPPTVLDNCGRTLTVSAPVISALPTCSGTRTYTYTYTSCSGTTYPWVYTYTVSAPTVTMPANGSSTVACTASATAPTPLTVLDNCGRTLTVSAPVVSANPACGGVKTYTYTYTSCSGTTYSWVYTYTISTPTVTMPANAGSTVTCPSATSTAPTPPTVLDNCGNALTISAPVISAIPTCAGTRTYTYTYTSCSGTTYPWVYTYTVSAPTVTMPANGSSTVACLSAITTPTAPTALDNCGRTLTVSAPVISPDPACGGTKTYTYTFTSCNGTTYPWTYTYTFNDNVLPTATNPSPISVTSGSVSAPDPLVVTTEADNCSTPTVAWVSDISDGNNCPEIITRTYSVTDACLNQILVTQTITIGDAILPTASNPGPVSVECLANVPTQNPAVVIDETDNNGAPTVTWEDDTSDGLSCPLTITRRYRVTDNCGNFIFVSQIITVDDITAPTATAPASVTVQCIGDVPAADVTLITDEADNCTAAPIVAHVGDVSDGNTCPETITRTYSITDNCGNVSTVAQTIIVDDTTPPTGTAPATITVQCIGDVPAADVTLITDEADNCTAAPVVAHVGDVSDGNTCPQTITRTYSITDNCGNVTNVTQAIVVDDITNPTASNPATTTVPGGPAPAPDPTVVIDEADNCTAAPIVAFVSESTDGGACPETITRIYSVTDNCGNTINVTHTILITDPFPPTASNPASVTVECIGDVPVPNITVVTDEADNQGTPTVAFVGDVSDGNTCPQTITRTYSVTDACGSQILVTQTIIVDDITTPTASAPASVTVQCIGDVPAADVTLITDEADNCTAAPIVAHVGDVSDGNTCPETITRTYSITDNCGNVSTVAQMIIVDDTTPPTGTAPATITVQCIGDVPAADVTLITDETDNCTAAPVVAHVGDVSDGNTCPQTITRTYSITDNCGNVTNVTQAIVVDDITNPTASNPATTTVPGGPAPAPDPTVVTDEADNCTAAPVVAFVSESTDGGACPETITRIYSVTDNCGNTINVTHTILITDPFPPTASNPASVTVECIGDVPPSDITVVTDEADNQGTPTVAFVGDVSDGNTCPQTITRTYSVTDACGSQILVTQTITVDDITAPTATAPASVTVQCIGDVPAADVTLITDEADNCTASPLVAHVGDVSDGNTCPETITRTYSITDNCGNVSTVAQTIIVDDTTPPTGTAPATVNVQCIGDVPAADVTLITDEADNCTAAPVVAHVGDVSDGNTCPQTITRTYSITDNCGNVTNVTQAIVVDDITNPTASNPATTTVPGGPAPAPDPTVVTDEADNCTAAPVVAFVSESTDGGACPETITRIYSVTDNCGNTINVTHTILITDPFPPTASNPASVTVECIGDVPLPDITVVTDEADNQGTTTVTFVNDVSDGNTCPETITRTYLITDICNNSITVTQTIIVDDITAPTASAPASVTVQCIGDVPAADVSLITDEADNCTAAPLVAHVGDVSDGNTCPETITRTYSITDNCGNVSTVAQTIIVDDTTPPTGTAPATITVQCIGDVPVADVTLITDEADNCTAAPVVAHVGDVSDGNTCPQTITRTYSITDNCGNTINVTQAIVVDDITNPTASNPATTSVPGGPAPAPDPTVVTDEADNCTAAPVVAFVSESTDGGSCPETITRIYSVTDNCGNTINVTHTILITDPFPPTASNPVSVTVECIGDVPLPDITVVTDEADNQGTTTVTFVNDVSDGNTCPETITRTYMITDICNNSITVTQTIIVDDTTAPTATAPASVTVQCIGDVAAADVTLITDEADNCTAAPIVAHVGDVSDGNTCPETITRTYSITDNCGNVSTVAQTIIVDDTIAPTASNLPGVLVECITDVPAANILDVTTESDNCTAAPIVAHVGDVSDGNSCPEKITRTYSITDNCGNAIEVTQVITIFDQTPPTASNPAQIFVVSAAAVPAPDVTAVIDEADNCTVNPTVVWVSDVSDGNVCNNETITRVFRITDDCGNQTTVTQLITITAFIPEINAGADQSICDGESVTLTAFNPDNAVITWNQNVTDGQSFTPAVGTTTYTVIGDIYGCTASDAVSVTVNTNPNVNFASDVVQGCEPLAVTLTNSSTSDSPLISCEWDMGDGTILNGCGSVDYIYQNPGLYDVTLTTTNSMGCSSSETFNNYIFVDAFAVANFSASEYSVSNLTVETEIDFTNQSSNASGYIWSFGDSTSSTVENPSHIFDTEQAGSYEVILIATSPLGCNDTVSHTITVTEELIYYIPNTFTPDGSMFNNVFQPVFTSGFDPYNFTMQIYNRWGELIFESFDATQGWDGTYLGKMMQSGTYTWKVEFKSRVNDKMYTDTGHVNLLR